MNCQTKKEICATYTRVSLEDQVENYSLSSQARAGAEYVTQKGYTLVENLCDDGYSGADLDRPALTKLRGLVRGKLIDVAVVYQPDRLARSLAHQIILQEEFDKAGVRLEYVTFTTPDNHEGRLMRQMQAVIAEYERETIGERTTRGRREKARQGLIVGGRRTFCYTLNSGKYTICETEATIVRCIFRWFVEAGFSIRQIVKSLDACGHKPHTSMRWAKSTVHRILSNQCYVGKAYYNRRKRVSGDKPALHRRDKKTKHQWRRECDWMPIEVPAIIDETTFCAAQQKLNKNREQWSGRPARHSWLLSGFLKCGKCHRRYGSYPTHAARYYRCTAVDKIAPHRCDAPKLKAEELENLVFKDLKRILANPQLLEAKLLEAAREDRDLDSELASVEQQLRTIRLKEAKLLDQHLNEFITESVLQQSGKALKSEREALEQSRQSIRDAIRLSRERTNVVNAATVYCRKITRHIETLDFARKRAVLKSLIDEIVVEGNTYWIKGAISFELEDKKLSTTC